MKKLLGLIGGAGILVSSATLPISVLKFNQKVKFSYSIEFEKDFEIHMNKIESLYTRDNLTFSDLKNALIESPVMIYKVYSEDIYDNYMNKIYGLLNKLDEIVIQNDDINNKNFALSIRRQIEKSNLDWRQELNQDEMLVKIENSQMKSLEIFESAYQSYNIGVSSLISKDIKEFSEAKIELAGLREQKTGLQTQLSDFDVFLEQYDMMTGIQDDITHVFNTMLETINEHLVSLNDIFPFGIGKEIETVDDWLNLIKERYEWFKNILITVISSYLSKENLKYSELEIEEMFNEEIKDSSNDDEKELFELIDEIFPEDSDIEEMMNGKKLIDINSVIDFLVSSLITEIVESAIPIVGQIKYAVKLAKVILLIQSAIFSNLFENMNFLRNYTLETIPRTASIIQAKYDESPKINGAQVANKLLNFKNIMDEATSKVLNVLKPMPISLVRDLIDVYEMQSASTTDWVSTAFTLIFAIKEPVKIIESLRDDIAEIPADVESEYNEIISKKQKNEENLNATVSRISFLENLLKNSRYEELIGNINDLNRKLKNYNDILNWIELKNYSKKEIILDPIKNLKENLKTLQWNELYRNNIVGKYLFLYGINLNPKYNQELSTTNNKYREIYFILENSLKGVLNDEDITYNFIYN